MLDFLPSCIRRHKKKLLFLGGVVGGIAFCNTYLKRKFIEWETQRTAEICDRLRRANHFEGTMNTCDAAFMNLVKTIRIHIYKEIDVDTVVAELKEKPPNKVQLWERLKVLVFTQVIGEMYATSLLCLLLRVQMSILSGYNFASRNVSTNPEDMQNKYMSHIEEFMSNGVSKLLTQVQQACSKKLKAFSLSKPLRLHDIEDILLSVREDISIINLSVVPDISCLIASPVSPMAEKSNFLRDISSETKDVLQCEDFHRVFDLCISCSVSHLMDMMSGVYTRVSSNEEFVNINMFEIPLAKLIPEIHNAFVIQEPADEDGLACKLIQIEKLNNFAANIYEAFSQKRY